MNEILLKRKLPDEGSFSLRRFERLFLKSFFCYIPYADIKRNI